MIGCVFCFVDGIEEAKGEPGTVASFILDLAIRHTPESVRDQLCARHRAAFDSAFAMGTRYNAERAS